MVLICTLPTAPPSYLLPTHSVPLIQPLLPAFAHAHLSSWNVHSLLLSPPDSFCSLKLAPGAFSLKFSALTPL